MSTVRWEQTDGIAVLTMDRPPVNAIDLNFVRDASAAIEEIASCEDLAALIMTGAGRAFSAGLDLRAVPSYGPAEQREMIETVNRTAAGLYALPIPTVAAVNGHAIAGGLVLALACDYRIGAESSCLIGLTEARAGIPFPAVPMTIVAAELAPHVARRLVLVARNLDPVEAHGLGILDEIRPAAEVLARARVVAADLASMPRAGYGKIKRQLRAGALGEVEHIVASGSDPMLGDWIGAEAAPASADLLSRGPAR